jgi:hypothetical protein
VNEAIVTLDDLLGALLDLKRRFPASGSAWVYAEPCDGVRYDRGDVYVPMRCSRAHVDDPMWGDRCEEVEATD